MAALRDRLPRAVRIVEVGPRDGLQNEREVVPTAVKAALVAGLIDAGLEAIEVTSFVRPDRVPQLADAEELFRALPPAPGVRLLALVPNRRGLDRALAAGCRAVAVFTAASETFNRRNINRGIDESLAEIGEVARGAAAAGVWLRGYVSTAFGCPYEGPVGVEQVRRVVARLLELGCAEVSVGDTIGVATPAGIERVVGCLLGEVPADRLALHLHDTRGTALANVFVGLELGIATFDAALGGLGGCPYAPGAAGNLATEDLVYLLDGLGIATGVDFVRLREASRRLEAALGRKLPSRALAAPLWPAEPRA